MLSFLPTTIKTAVDVNTILTGVNKCTVCPGNDYEQFAEVFGARNGTLRDSHGMCLLIHMYLMIYILCIVIYTIFIEILLDKKISPIWAGGEIGKTFWQKLPCVWYILYLHLDGLHLE